MAVLDISLDGQRSYPVADALEARGVPFAFLTGYGRDSLPSRYRFHTMLQKPFEQFELGDVLARLRASTGFAAGGQSLPEGAKPSSTPADVGNQNS